MEGMGIYENTTAFHIDKQNGDKSEPEDLKPEHWPRRTDTTRRNLSLKIIFALLGICILVSILSLVLAVILVVEMGKMKRSDADLRMDFSQWKNNGVHSCPKEWTKFKQSCYHFSTRTNTWVEAQRSCASADAHLAVINNAEEQSFLKKHVDVIRWIGLSDSASEGDWRWVDGTDYYSSVKFWADGQPNSNKNIDEDCVAAYQDGSWHDWPCSSEHTIICEKPAQ